jgi:hypothetical protein
MAFSILWIQSHSICKMLLGLVAISTIQFNDALEVVEVRGVLIVNRI